jgi:exodeoxyribonuclease V gamma subunit
VITHPLQPFDIRNVERGTLVAGTPFTFDPTVLVAAEAFAGERRAPTRFVEEPLPLPPADDVALTALLEFFQNPVKGFFTALDYTLPRDIAIIDDAMPVAVSGLEEWHAGDRMLRDMLRGIHPDDAANAEWRRGMLPPAQLGKRVACEIRDCARDLAVEALPHRQGDPDFPDVAIDLGSGRQLNGTVAGVYGNRLVSVTYSKMDCRRLLPVWIRLVVLAVQFPGRDWTASCIGRSNNPGQIAYRMLGAPADPTAVLADLVALYDAGRREPLPLPLRTSYAWAEARRCGDDPYYAANKCWESQYKQPGEDNDAAHEHVWGKRAWLDTILGVPRAGEEVRGEKTRLGALAARLWGPMIAAERITD